MKPTSDGSVQSLASQLSGTRWALLSVAKAMQPLEHDVKASIIRSQLEWAASHLFAAVKELNGDAVLDHHARALETEPDEADSPMEGLKGHTQAVTIPEILGFVSSMRKSGALTINALDESFLVQLEDGSVVYAQGDAPPPGQLLGDILVDQGAIKRDELEAVLENDSDSAQILGKTLLERGLITKEQLCIALSYQVQHVFHRMCVAEDAVFQFDEGMHMLSSEDIRLNVTSLLLESARSTDEHARDAQARA